MWRLIRDRRTGLLLLVVLAAAFVLMAVQVKRGGPSAAEGTLLRVAAPLVRGAAGITRGITGLWDEYVNLRHTRHVNASLEEKVTMLQVELEKLKEARIQNDRLRTLLDLREGMRISSVAANVIGNNTAGTSHTILVDRGSEVGVTPNMAVISAQGVVGRVWTVTRGVSKVQLITDAAAGTAVLVQRTRVHGVMLGRGEQMCALEYIATLDDVKAGDLLVTSGLDGIYPKGLPVGKIDQVGPVSGLMRSIAALPRVEFNRIEEVLILKNADLPVPERADRPGGAEAGGPGR